MWSCLESKIQRNYTAMKKNNCSSFKILLKAFKSIANQYKFLRFIFYISAMPRSFEEIINILQNDPDFRNNGNIAILGWQALFFHLGVHKQSYDKILVFSKEKCFVSHSLMNYLKTNCQSVAIKSYKHHSLKKVLNEYSIKF